MDSERRSALIDRLMADAPEAAREEATRNWFEFLAALAQIAARRKRERDSHESTRDDRFGP